MKYLIFFFSLFVILSCEDTFSTTLDLDFPEYEKQMVTYARMHNNVDTNFIYFTHTKGLGEEAVIPPQSAKISLSCENCEARYFTLKNGKNNNGNTYINIPSVPFIPNIPYNLTIESELGMMVAEAVMPEEIRLIKAEYQYNGGLLFSGERSSIDIEFIDDPSQENFYMATVIVTRLLGRNETYIQTTYTNLSDLTSQDASDEVSTMWDDSDFNGQLFSKSLQFYRYDSSELLKVELELSTITKEQFEFEEQLRYLQFNADNPFASPFQLSSNFDNGLGIFTIQNKQTITVWER